VGRALLVAVLHAAAEGGLSSVSLVVSHANANAFAMYESLGFVDHEQSWTLALPDQRKSR
jgi:ribosomal protein S18 acetylase RimI-like enzyme